MNAERKPILVVDDEEGPRQSLRIVFRELYDVVLAESGARALEIARSRRIDAAILDIRMTGMTGTQLLGHLKQLDPHIEVVMEEEPPASASHATKITLTGTPEGAAS